jgi:hypothetical protein
VIATIAVHRSGSNDLVYDFMNDRLGPTPLVNNARALHAAFRGGKANL